jgi:hypothetical protein
MSQDKGKKKAAAKAKKLAVTHKRMDQFVASFTLDGKTIQEQRSYKDMAMMESDREILATLKNVTPSKICPHIVDNRNQTEKKKAGVKSCAKEAHARKEVKEHEAKENPLGKKEDAQTTADLPPAYKPITADEAVAKFSDIVGELQEANQALELMKERHGREKKAAESEIEEIEKQLFELKSSINPAQMDLFRHAQAQAPAATTVLKEFDLTVLKEFDLTVLEEFDFDADALAVPEGVEPVAMAFYKGKMSGAEQVDMDEAAHLSDRPQCMNHLPLDEYAYAVRDYMADAHKLEPTEIMVKWVGNEPAKIENLAPAGPQDGKTAPDGTTGTPDQAEPPKTE